jgi:hypothetical protein
LRHRQTKGAATDMFYLTPPRHISTLPFSDLGVRSCEVRFASMNWHREFDGLALPVKLRRTVVSAAFSQSATRHSPSTFGMPSRKQAVGDAGPLQMLALRVKTSNKCWSLSGVSTDTDWNGNSEMWRHRQIEMLTPKFHSVF